MITCTVDKAGNLLLTADNETRAEIKELQARGASSDSILWELTEGYWTNGQYEPFDAGDGNPFVGLSSAPCIAEAMDLDDDGKKSIVGRYWAFMDYQITDPMETLKRTGRVVFDSTED